MVALTPEEAYKFIRIIMKARERAEVWPRELWEGASAQRIAMLDAIDEAMKEGENG